MGHNATVVVMVDALGDIEKDPLFGKKLAAAIRAQGVHDDRHQGVSAGGHSNAAHVVEQHHADQTAIITVGGNLGVKQHESYGWHHHEVAGQEKLLREWADKLGFDISEREPTPSAKPASRRP